MSDETVKTEAKQEKPTPKPTPKKPAVKKAKKVTEKKSKKHKEALGEARRERAIDELAEKAADTKVSAKGVTERLQQAVALYFVRYRKANGLTVKAMGEKLKLDPTHVSHMESGRRSLLRLDRAVEYAKLLAVKPEVMLTDIVKLAAS